MKITDTFHKLFKGPHTAPFTYADEILPKGIVSQEELRAISNSLELYRGASLSSDSQTLELASSISSELARLTVAEFSCSFSDKRADSFFEKSFAPFLSRMRIYTEYACASGGVIFKPFFDGQKLSAECILPFNFIPLEADGTGKLVSCAFIYTKKKDKTYFTRIEEHRLTEKGYQVTNRAFSSEQGFFRGKEASLSEISEWKNISPITFIENLKTPLFAYFGMPIGNFSFPASPLGAPIFRRAETLIKQADEQYKRLLWEFEGGELAIDASEDAFRIGKNGKPELPPGKERLYRSNCLDACSSTTPLFTTFAPALRDKSYINGLNRIIMLVEDACGIARGTFSDPSEIARTATEVRAMRQKTYSTVCSIQESLKTALYELFDAANIISRLYSLTHKDAQPKIKFGDSVLGDAQYDREAEREDVKCGIISPETFKERWY